MLSGARMVKLKNSRRRIAIVWDLKFIGGWCAFVVAHIKITKHPAKYTRSHTSEKSGAAKMGTEQKNGIH